MSGTIQNNLMTVRQGDSFVLNFEIKNKGKPVNLSGASLLMQARDTANNLIFSLSGTMVDAIKGKVALLLSPTQTNIAVGDYNVDIQLTTADGSVNTIWPANVNQIGTLRITAQVTVPV